MERSWDGSSKVSAGAESLKNEYKVDVQSLPEKKGLVIKHVEYLVTCEKHQSQVYLCGIFIRINLGKISIEINDIGNQYDRI